MQSLPEVIPGCREARATRVLHHRVGFAFRCFRRDVCGKQSKLVSLAGSLLNEVKCHLHSCKLVEDETQVCAAWPYWRHKRKNSVALAQLQPAAQFAPVDLGQLPKIQGSSSRVLKQHVSDESTWLDDASPSISDTISVQTRTRRVRRDRRRRAREHREQFEECARRQYEEIRNDQGASTDMWASRMLGSLVECFEEDLGDDFGSTHFVHGGGAESPGSSNEEKVSFPPLLISCVSHKLPARVFTALADFCEAAQSSPVHSFADMTESIASLKPRVADMEAVFVGVADWEAPAHYRVSWKALQDWILRESSGPVSLLQEIRESHSECVSAQAKSADFDELVSWHASQWRFNVNHTCKRLVQNLELIKYEILQEELRVDASARAIVAEQDVAQKRQATEAAVRANIATMSRDGLQELLAQRLSGSRVL